MQQLLMLGFYCEVYRLEPLCRVYINDVLVDEFNVPHTPRKDLLVSDFVLNPKFFSREQFRIDFDPPFFKCVELDDADGVSFDIRVEIHNNDNNYNNGFMTSYTRVMFSQCWLAPVKVWEKFDKIFDRWRFSRKNWHICDDSSAAGKYYKNKKLLFDNLAQYAYFYSTNQQPQSDQDYQHILQVAKNQLNHTWFGTSGYFRLIVKKKLGFWHHITDHSRGWCKLSWLNNVKILYDKYKANEDKRNINQ